MAGTTAETSGGARRAVGLMWPRERENVVGWSVCPGRGEWTEAIQRAPAPRHKPDRLSHRARRRGWPNRLPPACMSPCGLSLVCRLEVALHPNLRGQVGVIVERDCMGMRGGSVQDVRWTIHAMRIMRSQVPRITNIATVACRSRLTASHAGHRNGSHVSRPGPPGKASNVAAREALFDGRPRGDRGVLEDFSTLRRASRGYAAHRRCLVISEGATKRQATNKARDHLPCTNDPTAAWARARTVLLGLIRRNDRRGGMRPHGLNAGSAGLKGAGPPQSVQLGTSFGRPSRARGCDDNRTFGDRLKIGQEMQKPELST